MARENCYVILLFAVLFELLHLATGQCPRDEAAALAEDPTRSCRKECTVNGDCTGVKTCNCDGHCGMSCFNPDAECRSVTVDNGNIALSDGLKYGSEATVTCERGYSLDGQRVRTCRSTRKWSHLKNVPHCIAVRCILAQSPDNGGYSGGTTQEYGDVADYYCDAGYKLNGHDQGRCNENGTWGDAPTCDEGCLPPSDVGNAFVSPGGDINAVGYPVGHVVTYDCITGYDVAGNADRTCQSDFSWSPLSLSCTIRSCGAPPTVDHASYTGTNYDYGGSITYSCDTGYILDGTATFNCHAEGEWSPGNSWPTCESVRCIPPQSPDNGGYTGGTTQEYGDVVDYYCDAGYKLNGPDEGRCNENGAWGDTPNCDASVDATFNEAHLDGYTVVSGSWARTRVNDYRGLPGFSLLGDGTVRSVLYPLTGDQKICVQAYIKNTQANELKAQAFQGGETKDLYTFSASDAWKLEKFWLTPVTSADTQVQLQFVATDGSNVLLDEIKELSDPECRDFF